MKTKKKKLKGKNQRLKCWKPTQKQEIYDLSFNYGT